MTFSIVLVILAGFFILWGTNIASLGRDYVTNWKQTILISLVSVALFSASIGISYVAFKS